MQFEALLDRLRAGGEALVASFGGVTDEQARWRPAPDTWSVLDVAAHLVDEEREDFRARIEALFADPQRAWDPIDPEEWPEERDYASRDLATTVDAFRRERAASLVRMERHRDADWDVAHDHPQLGVLRAGDLLLSWVVHDALHQRQLARLHYRWAQRLGAPYAPDYAGRW